MLQPTHVETFIAYLLENSVIREAAQRMVTDVLDNHEFVSINNKSKHTLWIELCELVSKNPRGCDGINVEGIIRQGIGKFTDEVSVGFKTGFRTLVVGIVT